MKKRFLALTVASILILTLFASCKSKETLNLFTWQGMFPDEVLQDFTKETDIEINYSNFDTDEAMLSRLQSANGGEYDVIIANDYIIKTVVDEGLAQPLDKTKVPNFGNINTAYQGQFYDPADEYTVPYGAGVLTILYDPDKVSFSINGYSDLWNPELKNKVGVIQNMRVINGMALKTMGESFNTEDSALIRGAGERLVELAPNIHLIKDDNIQEDLIAGEIDAGIMYTSQVTTALLQKPSLKAVFPQEGIGFGIMANFVPVNAPNSEAAYKFIDYILRPDVSAKCFEFIGYYSTNQAADSVIDPSMKEYVTLPEGLSSNIEILEPVNSETEAVHMEVWTKFKTAAGA